MQDSSMKSRSPQAVREAVQQLMPEWNPDQIGEFEFLSGGYSNDNFRFSYQNDGFVVRLPSRARSFVDRSLERAFYDQNQDRLAIPQLIAFEETTGNLLTRYVPGDLLADARPSLESIADYLRALHNALPVSDRHYDPYALSREYLSSGDAPIPIRKLADGPWLPAETITCHNDLNPWNVIQNTTRHWVTLDWEWLGRNDPLFDLVTLHQGMQLKDDTLDTLIDLWADTQIHPGRVESCLIAYWLREFAWAWAERHHGNIREEIERQIRISREKLAALLS